MLTSQSSAKLSAMPQPSEAGVTESFARGMPTPMHTHSPPIGTDRHPIENQIHFDLASEWEPFDRKQGFS